MVETTSEIFNFEFGTGLMLNGGLEVDGVSLIFYVWRLRVLIFSEKIHVLFGFETNSQCCLNLELV